jgi:hypothetical protein
MNEERLRCQSCGMPIRGNQDFGTDAAGNRTQEYCCKCYSKGCFTEPNMTLEKMILRVAKTMHETMGMEAHQAANVAVAVIPKLKRWQ